MGAKQTKFEGTYLPETPTLHRVATHTAEDQLQQQPLTIATDLNGTLGSPEVDLLDPRSPNGCRTPISILYTRPAQSQTHLALYQQQHPTADTTEENPLTTLRKRFMKSFSYNLHDPRSPNMQLNRTPLVFDELNDKTLNLDDTFADLFVDSREPTETVTEQLKELMMETAEEMHIDVAEQSTSAEEEQKHTEDISIEMNSFVSELEEETMACPAKLQQTPVALQQQLDPRSPTIGVDRTPIIFSDDDEINEDAMLENILATLTLNLSSSSSLASFNAETMHELKNNTRCLLAKNTKPANKHLDRVRRNGSRQQPQKQQNSAQRRRQRIYEDRENKTSPTAADNVTPKKRINGNLDSPRKRTPLCCVKNRTHLRSRSVESSDKSLKSRLSLSSYDDSLNPLQNANVSNIRMLQSFEDSLEI